MFKPTTSLRSRLLLVSLSAALSAAPSLAAAQDRAWTTVGSAGTIDEDSLLFTTMNSATARVRENAPAGTVSFIRYNVVAVDGLFDSRGISLTARFYDREDADRVRIQLKRFELSTGGISVLVTLDSDVNPPSNLFQLQTVCNEEGEFDFSRYGYWVEVQLTKSQGPRRSGGGVQVLVAPAISMIQIAGTCGVVPS